MVLTGLTLLPPDLRLVAPDGPTLVVSGTGALLAVVTFLLPWETMRTDRALFALRLLMAAGIVNVGGLVATTNGASSDQLWTVLLITLFAAVVCDTRTQLVLYLLTVAAYLVGSALAGPIPAGTAAWRVAVLTVFAATAGYLSSLLHHAVAEARRAHAAAEAHAQRLSTVARGVKAATGTDPDTVLSAVVETVRELGWEHVGVYVGRSGRRLDLAASQNHARPDGATPVLPADSFASKAIDRGATVTAADAAAEPRLREAVDRIGIASAIATPFVADGEHAGVVVASSTQPHRFSAADVETFELLAGNAGRALELARRYANEAERVVELRNLDRLRSEFLSTVSHELRTPLTVILGLSETLDRAWEQMDDEQRRLLFDRVRDNAGGLDRVIASLLDFTRLEQGRLETRFDTFDLAKLVRTVVVRLASLLDTHHLELDVEGPLFVHGDDRLLERVIENLLSNAQRHTPAGTTVAIRCSAGAREVEVEISDDGPGIAPEELPRLGERFFRAGDPSMRASRGVGLGLALAQEVLRLHDSQLIVDSALGQGTAFSFSLPTAAIAVDDLEHRSDPAPRRGPGPTA